MKKVIISLLFMYSALLSAQTISNDEQNCVENLEREIVQIVNSEAEDTEKEKAIEILKAKVAIDKHTTCESELQEEIKQLVFGDKKINPNDVIKEHVKKTKKQAETANINSQDCIENFEAEVLRIINSNPDNTDKEKTKQIMHEIMHDTVKESCESAFENEVKKAVNSTEKN